MVVFRGPLIPIPPVSVQEYLYRDFPTEKRRYDIVEDAITGEKLTFGDFVDAAEDLAAEWLLPGGASGWAVEKGDVVGLVSPNHVDYFRAFFAVVRAGATVSTMNHLYTEFEFKHCMSLVKAKFLVVHPQMLSAVLKAADACGIPRKNIAVFDEVLVGGSIAPKPPAAKGMLSLREMMKSGRAKGQKAPWIELSADQVDNTRVWIPFSSGTTGLSKGVALSHYNLIAQVEQRIFIDKDDFIPGNFCSLSAAPPAHIGGGTFMATYLKAGVKSVLLPRYDIEPALRAVEKYTITFLPVLPPIAVAILAMGGRDYLKKFDLSSLRCVPFLGDRDDYLRGPDVKGTNGPPVPCLECKLIDPKTGKECGVGEEGEVWLRGPTVFMEYVDNPKATAEAKTDDLWYKSGDIATCDELGNLTVVDRIKELFKVSGFQVSPVELEAILITHPSVAEACVIGIPDNQRGEIPKAFLVLKPNAQASDDLARDIADFLAKKVAPKKKLYGGIEFVPEIVKNTMNKMQRQYYRDLEKKRFEERQKGSKL